MAWGSLQTGETHGKRGRWCCGRVMYEAMKRASMMGGAGGPQMVEVRQIELGQYILQVRDIVL